MRRPHLTSTAKRITLVVALLGVLGVAAGLALAASGPPAPTITSHPANPTASTSATFVFSDTQKKVAYLCSLDGAAYKLCETGAVTYVGLTAGSHTFRVEARTTDNDADDESATADSDDPVSSPTSFTWTIDLTPPAIGISFPANGGVYGGARWSAGCTAAAGACGTATDPSGVSSVVVSIRQSSTGRYWNGSAFSSLLETYFQAKLVTTSAGANWSYALPLPSPDGQYTLHARATDSLGNTTPAGSPSVSVFTIDSAPPPAPTITSQPANPTNQTTASLGFSDSEAGTSLTFMCKLDSGSYIACTSPASYSGLTQGSHTFHVDAIDAAGNVSAPATYTWVVITTPPPAPTITSKPTNPTTSTAATFTFTDSQSPVTFQCQIDSSAWSSCTSPVTYTGLGVANHTFSVRAVDTVGNISTATSYTWAIQSSSGQPFTISGNAVGLLYPGAAAQALAIKLSNPNNAPIFVTALSATLSSTGLPAGCPTANFAVTQSNVSSTSTVQVPANGSVTLPAQGVSAPTVQMLDTHVNQNACAGATLTFSYNGSAHS
jgi:hypothetical protein